LAGDRAIAQLGAIVDIPFTLKGIEAMISSHARLLFRAERRAGVWRLSGLDAVYLRDKIARPFQDRLSRLIQKRSLEAVVVQHWLGL